MGNHQGTSRGGLGGEIECDAPATMTGCGMGTWPVRRTVGKQPGHGSAGVLTMAWAIVCYNAGMPIHLLPPEVASKIAAGEVVERPANVIKELVENAIDAGATEIRVEVREGGRRLMRITDNGHGIPAQEAPLAFERHATSKLANVDDLNHIATFGFRGEALYSIAAVSQLTLTTRHLSEDFAVMLRLEGGNLASQSRAGAPVGTTVNVENLFYNVPARQKFLRPPATEAGQIARVIERFALAHPDRRFGFVNEGKLVFQSNGTGNLLDVLVKVYSTETARQLVPVGTPMSASGPDALDQDIDFMADPVDAKQSTIALPAPTLRVSGYASLPSLTRPNRSEITLFVNRRFVEDRSITHAVVQAYHTLLPVGRYPMAVILIDVDPALVDVNVHPQKTQVRFAEERQVFSAVQKAVRRAIVGVAPIPDVTVTDEGRIAPAPAADENWIAGWAARREAILAAGQHQRAIDFPSRGSEGNNVPSSQMDASDVANADSIINAMGEAPPIADTIQEEALVPGRQAELSPRKTQLPPLRVVGQIGATYIVAEGPDSMFLIDQHAAHERILYEKFLGQRYGAPNGVARQALLEPLTLHFGTRLAGMVAGHLTELAHAGFDVEPFGGETFLVRAVPSALAGEDPLRVLDEIAGSMAERRNLVGEELEDQLVKMVCKRAAIKAGQLLSDIEMQELIRQLEECQSPRTCPHGRPTMIQVSAGELEKAFGRI